MTRHAAILALVLLAAEGCEKKPTAPAQAQPVPAAATPAAAPSWAQVTASDQRTAMAKFQHLIRHVDAWHKGQKPDLSLTFAGGQATDGLGNSFAISAEDWKAIQSLIRGAAARESLTIRAGASSIYSDGLGDVPRFNYDARMSDDMALTLRLVGPHAEPGAK